MQVQFVANDFLLTPSLRDHVVRRLGFAFMPLRNRIQSIFVRLRDLNGPRGGRDMMCQVTVVIPGRPTLLIKDVQEDLYAAIDRAFNRAAYRASQIVKRERDSTRKMRKHPPLEKPEQGVSSSSEAEEA